jgi:hypothetical protein
MSNPLTNGLIPDLMPGRVIEPPHPADSPPAQPRKAPEWKNSKPYVWVTWIAGLIAGDDNCWWAAWFRAHHKFTKRDRDGDLDGYKRKHAAALRVYAAVLEGDGYTVYLEGMNEFKIEGRVAIISGKPDIVAVKKLFRARPVRVIEPITYEETDAIQQDEVYDVVVVDVKTGKKRDKDRGQVLLYLFAYTIVEHPGFPKGTPIRGRLIYQDTDIHIPADALGPDVRARIIEALQLVGHHNQPRRVPSFSECLFCDISKHDCPDRIDEAVITTTEVF